jgi:hypothetical protein
MATRWLTRDTRASTSRPGLTPMRARRSSATPWSPAPRRHTSPVLVGRLREATGRRRAGRVMRWFKGSTEPSRNLSRRLWGPLWDRRRRASKRLRSLAHAGRWAEGTSAASVAVYLTRGQYATGTEGRRRPAQTFFSCASPSRSSLRAFSPASLAASSDLKPCSRTPIGVSRL